MKVIVTGGAGFIGSALIRYLIKNTDCSVLNLDKLTYAGNPDNLKEISASSRYQFVRCDIFDDSAVREIFRKFAPDTIMHLAAETHVDRSIDAPLEFVRTNVMGSAVLLHCALDYFMTLPDERKANFRFQQL